MKSALIFLTALFLCSVINAQSDRYVKAMERNLYMMDSASTPYDFIVISNGFERIAIAEKNQWLPYYYAGYCLIISSFIDSTTSQKDLYLDRAEKYLNAADSLEPDNSEIYTLKGMHAQARMAIDPMTRWQQYGQLSNSLFQKAMELDPANPRPETLIGNTLYHTPEAFGGGSKTAEPVLRVALEKYSKFVPATSISPKWGKNLVDDMLKSIASE